MQKGTIRQWGNWWQLKYRDAVIENGVKKRVQVYKNLAPIDRDHQPKKDDSAPESVLALAALELAPINAGQTHAQSVDSMQMFLEGFLQRGEGGRGGKLKASTLGAYQDAYKLLQPYLREIKISQVRVVDIDRLLREVAEGTKFALAKTTYSNLKNFLSSAFRQAARQGIINFNPVRDAAIPRGKPSDTYAYSMREVVRMVKALKKHPNAKAAVIVAAFTGLRRGEISGLRWEDYDRKNQELVITRNVYEGVVQTTKTEASAARVPVIEIVRKALKDHLQRNSGDGYIFHDSVGNPMRFENFTQREVQPVLEKAGVPWHGLHAFRRFLGTTLNDKGIDLETIKDVLRHSNNDVTKKSYIKPSTKRFRKMLEIVEKDFKRA